MSSFGKESMLLRPVSAHLRHRGFRRQHAEVQFYEYSIDLYGYSTRSNSAVAVELKLTRWRRALEQAVIYQLCADLVYVALPLDAAGRVECALFAEHGVGLIGVSSNKRCSILLEAMPSHVVLPDYREFYVRLLQESERWPEAEILK